MAENENQSFSNWLQTAIDAYTTVTQTRYAAQAAKCPFGCGWFIRAYFGVWRGKKTFEIRV